MGLFDKLKKSVKSSSGLVGLATGGASGLFNGASIDALSGGKSSKMINKAVPGFNDLLLGKKAKDINPDDIANQIRATQSKGLGELNSALDAQGGAEGIARLGNAQAQKGILSSAQDARRNAQMSMARQGLKGTSLGLGLNRSIDQSTGRDIASLNAQLPGQIRNQQLQDAQTRIGAGNINQSGMNFNKIEGSRSGGLLGIASVLAPMAGTVAGAMAGGPAGAAAGGQMGSGLSQALNQQQNPQGAYNPNKYSMGNYQF